jgi:hypothetical protein
MYGDRRATAQDDGRGELAVIGIEEDAQPVRYGAPYVEPSAPDDHDVRSTPQTSRVLSPPHPILLDGA